MFQSSKYLYKQFYMTRSSTLEKRGRTDIGLITELLSKAVYTVINFGIFKSCRNIFFSKDQLNRYCKDSQSSPKRLLITLKLISSCPEHLFVFTQKKVFFNLLTLIGLVGIVVLDFSTQISKDLVGAAISFVSSGPISIKKFINSFAKFVFLNLLRCC